ncbi:hypothetical protein GCM10010398_20630 [Streptomyces fimbriatus]
MGGGEFVHSGSVHGAGCPAFNRQWYGAPGEARRGGDAGALAGHRAGASGPGDRRFTRADAPPRAPAPAVTGMSASRDGGDGTGSAPGGAEPVNPYRLSRARDDGHR